MATHCCMPWEEKVFAGAAESKNACQAARCYDEAKDRRRKGDKPSSHFERSLSDNLVLCQLGQALGRIGRNGLSE
jgi:hypothetical protein